MKQLSMRELNRPAKEEYAAAEKMPVMVVLDNIRSGLNVGAIFRTCDAFAVEKIFLCGITVKPPHAEILKTALGATETVVWEYVEDTIDAIGLLRQTGYKILAVEQTNVSVSLDQEKIHEKTKVALLFGNEMRGISPDVLQLCDSSIEIPQSGVKHSLNVATTAGIVLWEFYRHYRLRRLLSSS